MKARKISENYAGEGEEKSGRPLGRPCLGHGNVKLYTRMEGGGGGAHDATFSKTSLTTASALSDKLQWSGHALQIVLQEVGNASTLLTTCSATLYRQGCHALFLYATHFATLPRKSQGIKFYRVT